MEWYPLILFWILKKVSVCMSSDHVIISLYHVTCRNAIVSFWNVFPPRLVIVAFVINALWRFRFFTRSRDQKSSQSVKLGTISSFTQNLVDIQYPFWNFGRWYKKLILQSEKLLQSGPDNSYQKFITKCERGLLQSVSGIQNASGITKCDRLLLQTPLGITKCDRLLIQSASGITKCNSH